MAARGRPRRALLALAALLAAAHAVRAAPGDGCRVHLDVNASRLAFEGSSSASLVPGSFPVQPPEGTPIGLAGSMYLSLSGEKPCPLDAEGWAAAAAPGSGRRLLVTSAPSPYVFAPLDVFPEQLRLSVLGLPLNITGLSINLTLAGGAARGAAAPAAVAAPLSVDAVVVGGRVFSDTPMTGGPQLQPMAETRAAPATAAATFAVSGSGGGGEVLTVSLPDFRVEFTAKTSGVVGGRPWTGELTFSLSGPLRLSGALGCPVDCGDYGRCVPLGASASAAAAKGSAGGSRFGCECECGWAADAATGRCEVPLGACPAYGSQRGAALAAAAGQAGGNGSAACAGGDGASVAAAGGACPTGYGFDVFSRSCSRCGEGWAGPGCKMCTADKACQAKLSKPAAICNTGLAFNERSSSKYYSCSLSNPSIARIIGPVLPLQCETAAAPGGGAGGKRGSSSALAVDSSSLLSSTATCSITMRLVGMPMGSSATCKATGCHFSAGSPSFVCDGVACSCPSGCPPAYAKTFGDVSGAVTLNCDATGQDCTIVIGSLNMKIAAACEASECLDPEGPKVVGTEQQARSAPPLAPPLVAALPLLALVLGGLVCGAAMFRYRRYLVSGGGGGGGGPLAGGVAVVPAPAAALNGGSAKSPLGGGDAGGGGGAAPPTMAAAAAKAAAAAAGSGGSSPRAGPLLAPAGGSLTLTDLIAAGGGGAGGAAGRRQIRQLSFADVTADVRARGGLREALLGRPLRALRRRPPSSRGGADVEAGGDGAGDGGAAAAAAANGDGGGKAAAAAAAAAARRARASSGSGGSSSGGGEPGRWRPVLRGVSGCVGSGEVLGIMGPSGGGKSTLLMKLCGSLGAGGRGGSGWRSGGSVSLDGVAAPPSLLAAVTALVPQDDALMRSLTVEECIRYSAALRLDPCLPPAAVSARVEAVMATLGLSAIRGSTVLSGTGVAGVSGGERRRVGIAMELVIDPQVLVLDEPLSGLDSFTALQLMATLRAVAASGRVVALSLHQPTPALFGALDSAMLLAAGRLVYSGPPAEAEAALRRLGCPAPAGITVAEHLLHVVSDPESLQVVVAAALRQQAAAKQASAASAAAAALLLQQQQQQQQQGGGGGGVVVRHRHSGSGGSSSWFGLHGRSASNDSSSCDQQPPSPLSAAAANGAPPQLSAATRVGPSPPLPGAAPAKPGGGGGGGGSATPPAAQWVLRAAGTFSPRASASGQARVALGLPQQRRPAGRQVAVLFWRGLLDMLRNPLLTAFHAVGGLVLGLLVGVIFFGVKSDTSGAQNRVGALFFALCLLAFTSVTSVDLVQAESAAASREMQRRYYSPAAYAATKLVLDGLLLRVLPALLFGLPFYFLMGLNPAPAQVFVFLFVLAGFSAAVGALALGFASALDSPGKTILVMNLVLLLGVLFGGFLANKESIPPWLRWVSWLSVFRYAWEALVINELQGIDLFLSAPGVSLSLPVRGEVFLQIIGVDVRLFMADVGVLAGTYAAACAFVVAVLAWRNRQRKH